MQNHRTVFRGGTSVQMLKCAHCEFWTAKGKGAWQRLQNHLENEHDIEVDLADSPEDGSLFE